MSESSLLNWVQVTSYCVKGNLLNTEYFLKTLIYIKSHDLTQILTWVFRWVSYFKECSCSLTLLTGTPLYSYAFSHTFCYCAPLCLVEYLQCPMPTSGSSYLQWASTCTGRMVQLAPTLASELCLGKLCKETESGGFPNVWRLLKEFCFFLVIPA
jgi:hypothetical protein